jgi:hypothetical protein
METGLEGRAEFFLNIAINNYITILTTGMTQSQLEGCNIKHVSGSTIHYIFNRNIM